jgi:uncharacterized protein (TIGR02757 family)
VKKLPPAARLRRHLDRFLEEFPREDHLAMDPVQFVHRYDDPGDREVVGLIASSFAYGNVKSVLASVESIVSRLGPRPRAFVVSFNPITDPHLFGGFRHRWSDARDLTTLLWILGRLVEAHGSIERAFTAGRDPETPVAELLDGFSATALGFGHERFYSKSDLGRRRGVRYFFPKSSDGSACKRLNLYLRWMVRPADGIDCGVWSQVAPSRLVIPLDTHIARISRYIGLTETASPGWRMAEDITASLRLLDPGDPLKYDFALCHLGIAGDCPKKRDWAKCLGCPIRPVCRL